MRFFILILLLLAAPPAHAERVTVFAASSLKPVLDTLVAHDPDISVSYASSAVLARQIAQGAPADLFISANLAWADFVMGVPGFGRARVIARNSLIIAGAEPAHFDLAALPERLGDARLGIPDVTTVPLGIYAANALRNAGIYDQLEPRFGYFENARQTVAFLQLGEVPYAILYASDAANTPGIHKVADIPLGTGHGPIYLGLAGTEAGLDMLNQLLGDAAQEKFVAYGFQRP